MSPVDIQAEAKAQAQKMPPLSADQVRKVAALLQLASPKGGGR